jgi:hypothetical protein
MVSMKLLEKVESKVIAACLIILVSLSGALSANAHLQIMSPTSATPECVNASSGFVQIRASHLCLDASRVRFVGANDFNLLDGYLPGGGLTPSGPSQLAEAGQAHIRLFKIAMDSSVSSSSQLLKTNPQAYFSSVDSLFADAKSNGVMLNPIIGRSSTYWSSLTGDDYFTVGSKANILYKTTWVAPIVSHYRNNTQIAWWEIAGEPDCCNYNSTRINQIVAWATDMAAYVKSLDSNHRVGGDWSGYVGYSPTTNSLNFTLLDKRNACCDLVSLHPYDYNGALNVMYQTGISASNLTGAIDEYVRQITNHAHTVLGKPMEFAEYGSNLVSDPTGTWNQIFMNAMFTYDTDSSEVWAWEGSGSPLCSTWSVSQSCTPVLMAAMTNWSNRMSSSSQPAGPDFGVTEHPNSLTLLPGGSTTATLIVESFNGYKGNLDLGVQTASQGISTSLSASHVSVAPGMTVNTTLTVSAKSSAIPGNYAVVATATNGTISRSSTPLIVQVQPTSAGTCLLCWFFPAGWLAIWPYLLTGLVGVTVYLSIKISKDRARLNDLVRQRKSLGKKQSISPNVSHS